MTSWLAAGLALGSALVGVQLEATQDSGAASRVRQFLEARNLYRIDEAVAVLDEDATLRVPGEPPMRGREALARRLRWDSVVATQWRPSTLRAIGDTVVAHDVVEANAWLQLLGVGYQAFETVTFVLRGNRIVAIAFAGPREDRRALLETAFQDFLPWARHEYPERLRRVRPEGTFAYDPRRAADWLSLVRAWRAQAGDPDPTTPP